MLLSKEANTKDVQLKSQLMMSFQDDDSTKGSEFIWSQHGFFGEQNIDLTIPKANFPELTLCYINQARVSLVKSGGRAIYCDNVILGQIMPMAALDPSIDLKTYEPNENEVVMYVPLYNVNTGLFRGLTHKLGLITVRGDEQERFFSYGYSKEKSKVLYCNMKTQLPNIFSSTCFTKHTQTLLDQNENGIKQSRAFFFLPATLDRKENILQYKDNVHLHPVDIEYHKFKDEFGIESFNPSLLERRSLEENSSLRSAILRVMKKIVMISNHNLVRNANAYMAQGGQLDKEMKFEWIDDSQQASTLLQLTY